jgi:hypothetical protein
LAAASGDSENGQLLFDLLAIAVTAVGRRVVARQDLFKSPAAILANKFE